MLPAMRHRAWRRYDATLCIGVDLGPRYRAGRTPDNRHSRRGRVADERGGSRQSPWFGDLAAQLLGQRSVVGHRRCCIATRPSHRGRRDNSRAVGRSTRSRRARRGPTVRFAGGPEQGDPAAGRHSSPPPHGEVVIEERSLSPVAVPEAVALLDDLRQRVSAESNATLRIGWRLTRPGRRAEG